MYDVLYCLKLLYLKLIGFERGLMKENWGPTVEFEECIRVELLLSCICELGLEKREGGTQKGDAFHELEGTHKGVV